MVQSPGLSEKGGHLLGLFPWFGEESTGGVQLSGRLGWQGIVRARGTGAEGAQLFCYHPSGSRLSGTAAANMSVAYSRLGVLGKAVARRGAVERVLIWHIDLLKLIPFLGLGRAPVALFLHSIEVWRDTGWLNRQLLKRVDLFLSNSRHTWERFLAYHPWLAEAGQRTVHLGVGRPLAGATPAYDGLVPAALMVSRLEPNEDYKGHKEMIRAWPQVLKQVPQAQLWIAGEGGLRPALEEMAAAGNLGDQVRFWGWVSEQEKEALLRRCRCLALPSRGEGFGLVYVEAMRLGRPCLVSTLDAGREVVQPPEAGLAVDPNEPEALAEAICRLLTPGPEWERWSRQARARYEAHFTARHYQERLVAALFGGKGGGGG